MIAHKEMGMLLEAIEVDMSVRIRSDIRPGVHNGQVGVVTSLGVFSETARDRNNAWPGRYARPVGERPYVPVKRKSNSFGPAVRWDMPPVRISHYVPMSEHHERYYGEK